MNYGKNTDPWNKGRLVGQKKPFTAQDIWTIRIKNKMKNNVRDLALFNLAIDSKLRCCDLVDLRLKDIYSGNTISKRATIVQRKTKQPVTFEICKDARDSLNKLINKFNLRYDDYIFQSRKNPGEHISRRQYSRIVKSWAEMIGGEPSEYGTHSLRRTKATIIYKETKNLRAVQLLLGHTKLESTVRYLGVEVDDALEIAEHIDI